MRFFLGGEQLHYNFDSLAKVKIEWIFGGYDLEGGGTVSESGFVRESGGDNKVKISVFTPNSAGTEIVSPNSPFLTNITGGSASIFAILDAGDYTLKIDNTSPSAKALYDIRISAVPLPAAAWFFGSALIGAGLVSRRRNRTA